MRENSALSSNKVWLKKENKFKKNDKIYAFNPTKKLTALKLATDNRSKDQAANDNATIGIHIGTDTFGKDIDFSVGGISVAHHAMIAGQSGKGKSNLLNLLVANAIKKYTSDQLQFFIIDCSLSSFFEFKDSTSVKNIIRSDNPDEIKTAIDVLADELQIRQNLCKTDEVESIEDYRIKNPHIKIHNLICVIDEFHILYTGTLKQSDYFDKILIDKIVRIGRKYGVHLIVATQSLGGGVRRVFLDNIPLRIAFGMTSDQSNSFLSIGNTDASNLPVGEIIYNDSNGIKDANKHLTIQLRRKTEIISDVSLSNKNNNVLNRNSLVTDI